MKFSEVEEASWSELQPFFDTCLIPYTGLTGKESPMEATAALSRLRDFMDLVELPFKGRIITYPAVQYKLDNDISLLNGICHNVKSVGFKHVIIMGVDKFENREKITECDLVLSLRQLQEGGQTNVASIVSENILNLWKAGQP